MITGMWCNYNLMPFLSLFSSHSLAVSGSVFYVYYLLSILFYLTNSITEN